MDCVLVQLRSHGMGEQICFGVILEWGERSEGVPSLWKSRWNELGGAGGRKVDCTLFGSQREKGVSDIGDGCVFGVQIRDDGFSFWIEQVVDVSN